MSEAGTNLETQFRETRHDRVVLAAVWALSAVYLGVHLRQGWAALDAGPLAQMAERVLRGQVPDRDFVELYTGGLDYFNALAFRLLGVNLFSLRVPLFLLFLGWVPSVYLIARRFAGPVPAAGVTLLSVAWSVPNYPEAQACWYNLFFATWGTLGLLRYLETSKSRFLWIAGVCAGLSFLVKVVALYFVAAALLFFIVRELRLSGGNPGGARSDARLYRIFVTTGMLAFLAWLFDLISWVPTIPDYVDFFLPSVCLVAVLLRAVWQGGSAPGPVRFRRLLGMGLPFSAGALLPISFFLLWLAHEHALAAWFTGTFVAPTARLLWVSGPPASLVTSAGLIPPLIVALLGLSRRPSFPRASRLASAVGLASLLLVARWSIMSYVLIGVSAPFVVIVVAADGLVSLRAPSDDRQQSVFLILAVAVLWALVQFPAPSAIYFDYAAPLVALAVSAVISSRGVRDRFVVGSLLSFYLIFAVWLRPPGYWFEMRQKPLTRVRLQTLRTPRGGGLRVDAGEAEEYDNLVRLIRAHADGGYIYCAPDCPAVYFLSGEQNPTGSLNDFLDPDFTNVQGRTARILGTLWDHRVRLVVLERPSLGVSGPIPASLRAALEARFPLSARVGDFQVRWAAGGRPGIFAPGADPPPWSSDALKPPVVPSASPPARAIGHARLREAGATQPRGRI